MNRLTTILIMLFVIMASVLQAKKVIVKVTCSERDAVIYVNGEQVGTGSARIKIMFGTKALIIAKKIGYANEELILYYDKAHKRPSEKQIYHLTMKKDDAHEASTSTDQVNIDIEIKTSKREEEAWHLISEIVTSNFEFIETSDKTSGYLKTSWALQSFQNRTIRTRLIVKSAGVEPLKYKVKIISEYANKTEVSVKSDEDFKSWERLLKKYVGIIEELQVRLR
jgi:hypothetical protein